MIHMYYIIGLNALLLPQIFIWYRFGPLTKKKIV